MATLPQWKTITVSDLEGMYKEVVLAYTEAPPSIS